MAGHEPAFDRPQRRHLAATPRSDLRTSVRERTGFRLSLGRPCPRCHRPTGRSLTREWRMRGDERLDGRVRGMLQQLRGGSDLDQSSAREHRDAIRHAGRRD